MPRKGKRTCGYKDIGKIQIINKSINLLIPFLDMPSKPGLHPIKFYIYTAYRYSRRFDRFRPTINWPHFILYIYNGLALRKHKYSRTAANEPARYIYLRATIGSKRETETKLNEVEKSPIFWF